MSSIPEILYDSSGFLIANKPSGMLTEGGGHREEDLEQTVSKIVGRQVWCCHRLDRLTSGIVVLRKGKRLLKELSHQFEGKAVRKEYWLLVDGIWDRSVNKVETLISSVGPGIYENVISGGKPAKSTFRVLGVREDKRCSWLSGLLKTGRTHQLRLHALQVGCPVCGDPVYGTAREDQLFGLHARLLKMKHPETGEQLCVEADPPQAWQSTLQLFEN